VDIIRVVDGKAVEHWGWDDMAERMALTDPRIDNPRLAGGKTASLDYWDPSAASGPAVQGVADVTTEPFYICDGEIAAG